MENKKVIYEHKKDNSIIKVFSDRTIYINNEFAGYVPKKLTLDEFKKGVEELGLIFLNTK